VSLFLSVLFFFLRLLGSVERGFLILRSFLVEWVRVSSACVSVASGDVLGL